ncbi:Inner membrane protein YrbG [Planctomycetales bacterium 10988]|nr:Inner membrane protein YrbG [Planctomycetales bacterium 10988]
MVLLTFFLGLGLLTLGAELLVRSASRLAAMVGISPLVIGLTVVALGTSAPELVVSIQSTWAGQPEVALGNVLGSNIFNILFILGVSALIIPLRVSVQLIRFDVPLMVAISILILPLAYDGTIGRIDGGLLTAGLVAYMIWTIRASLREETQLDPEVAAEFEPAPSPNNSKSTFLNVGMLLGGLALLVLGSQWFTSSAVEMARQLGFSELVIGLTLVAGGTSLPEVATSVMAALRGERDIAVGNVVGSNLFNLLGVLGIAGLVSPAGIPVPPTALSLDLPVMIAVSIACLPIFFTGHLIARWEGGLFLGYYVLYTTYLILAASSPTWTKSFSLAMCFFVVPLTVLTLGISLYRAIQKREQGEEGPSKP